ncbi:MAG: nitrous oxide reductase accessory protein NosL [Phycisphaerales bacterium JB040]
MRRFEVGVLTAVSLACVAGCGGQDADAPPGVRLGDSVCHQCDMIISDERWAVATIVEGARGPEPRLFDDFNCQVNHEIEQPGLRVLARWSHAHDTREWIRTEEAGFLMSPGLRTPMGSKVAAFASRADAESARAALSGDVMDFETVWKRLGFAGACCPGERDRGVREDTKGDGHDH